jgi:hypothetical protein
MSRQPGHFCSQCGAALYRPAKSGLCKRCWNASGMAVRGVARDEAEHSHHGQLPSDTTRATCWNKHCRKRFNCPPWKDPKYSLCPKCLAAYDECNGLPAMEPVYVLAE